jgi:hypothetical protein
LNVERAVGKLPFAGELMGYATRIEYEHVDDEPGTVRVHDFGPGVALVKLTDRAVVMTGEMHPIVARFG